MKQFEVYRVVDAFNDEESYINPETGEIDIEMFNNIKLDIDEKLENVIRLIKNTEAEKAALKQAADELVARAKQKEKTIESWKRCLAYALGATNKVKFEGVAGSTGFKKLPPSVKLDDDFVEKWKESGKYLRQAEPEPDKKAIAEALKNGETVEGARLETGTKLYVK